MPGSEMTWLSGYGPTIVPLGVRRFAERDHANLVQWNLQPEPGGAGGLVHVERHRDSLARAQASLRSPHPTCESPFCRSSPFIAGAISTPAFSSVEERLRKRRNVRCIRKIEHMNAVRCPSQVVKCIASALQRCAERQPHD